MPKRGKEEAPAPPTVFARALAAARQRAGLTQAQVSERTGRVVAQPTISEWEAGSPPGDPADVFAVERALGMPAGALSGYLGYLPREVFGVSIETAIAVDDRFDENVRKSLLAILGNFSPDGGNVSDGHEGPT
jgi:transcriptional regulator with XRE-family HTH domain